MGSILILKTKRKNQQNHTHQGQRRFKEMIQDNFPESKDIRFSTRNQKASRPRATSGTENWEKETILQAESDGAGH